MNASLVFTSQGTFVLDGRSFTLEELEGGLRALPGGTSILVTLEKRIDDRSIFRQVARWIHAAGLDARYFDVSALSGGPVTSKPVDG
jgi:hypothetical protein